MNIRWSFWGVIAVSALIFWARVVPHSANFTPVIALFLVAGFLGQGRWFAFLVPLFSMVAADFIIGFYPGWAWTYLPLVFLILIGKTMKNQMGSLALTGFIGATLFFVFSNLGVWLYSGIYEQSADGLRQCYLAALPFFRYTVIGTFLGLGLFHLAGYLFKKHLVKTLLEKKSSHGR